MRVESRVEKICTQLMNAAERGEWQIGVKLYPSEMKRLMKQWHINIVPIEESGTELTQCVASWENAFQGKKINFEQGFFIGKVVDEMPYTENIAQQLYLLAARKNTTCHQAQ